MKAPMSMMGSAEWYSQLDQLPTPLARTLDLFATARGNDRLRWVACRDFCTLSLAVLHGLARAARAGSNRSRTPIPPSAPFPRIRERMEWGSPRDILHDWKVINPRLPRTARLPLDHASAFPELDWYAKRLRLPKPTHAVEALALLASLAEAVLDDQQDAYVVEAASPALDDLLPRLAFHGLRFLTGWTLAVRLPVAPRPRETLLQEEALILRGMAPRREVLSDGLRNAPPSHVVAIPVAGGELLDLHPLCLFEVPPASSALHPMGVVKLSQWPSVLVLTSARNVPLYHCTTSGTLFERPELVDAVRAALDGTAPTPSGSPARWGLLWIAIRKMRDLNTACKHGVADRILVAMDHAASVWTGGNTHGTGPVAYPFWRHGDEMVIPFRYAKNDDPFAAVCSAAARIVAAAVDEAIQSGIDVPWPAGEADQHTHTLTAGPLKLTIGFTLDADVAAESHEPFARRMAAELDHLRKAEKTLAEVHGANAPLLWIGREGINDQLRARITPLFARVSESAFAVIRNAANPSEWMLRRNRHRGIFNLVGGHLEAMDGDDGLALIRREIREELGLTVKSKDLSPIGGTPVQAVEFSDRAKCMTFYISRFFQTTLPATRFDAVACQAHRCRWETVARIIAPHSTMPTDIAGFPARLLATAADGAPDIRQTHALCAWNTLLALTRTSDKTPTP